MLLMEGELLDYIGKYPVVITTNGTVRKNGLANMGNGNARQVSETYTWIAKELGKKISTKGNHVHQLQHNDIDFISFPVEQNWSSPAEVSLIIKSAKELKQLCDDQNWEQIYMPLPGCGGGGLKDVDVIPIIAEILDNRFMVITKKIL